MVLLAVALTAQVDNGPERARQVRSLVNQLELEARRPEAVRKLLALGGDAVPALATKLTDPRPEVVHVVCRILCALGPAAVAAEPFLLTASGAPDPTIARMAKMTVLALQPHDDFTICEYQRKRIVRIDADGTEHELFTGAQAWDVDVLPDGHLLLTHYQDKKVVEYDKDGNEVWSFTDVRMPIEADRLLDGHTLIADMNSKRVIEVDLQGKIVWEHKCTNGQPYDVERLACGNTLITLFPQRVIEVTPAGKIVWDVTDGKGVFDADRLPNGNTLLTLFSAGKVQEVDGNGKVVWEIGGLAQPNDADRLPNGNTVVCTGDGVIEYAPDGSEVHAWRNRGRVSEYVRR